MTKYYGIEIPDILSDYKFNQTLHQAQRNSIEIEGNEFALGFMLQNPEAIKRVVENQRLKKEALDKLLATKAPGFTAGGVKATDHIKAQAEKPESVIPLDKIAHVIQRPDNRRRHMHVIISMLHECMTNEAYSAAYYCSKSIDVIKAQFVKVLTDLCIDPKKYDAHSVESDIRFSNGSRLVFVQSMSFGDFHIVAPEEPKPFSLAESKAYTKYLHGVWLRK
jgi:hypothetical protein